MKNLLKLSFVSLCLTFCLFLAACSEKDKDMPTSSEITDSQNENSSYSIEFKEKQTAYEEIPLDNFEDFASHRFYAKDMDSERLLYLEVDIENDYALYAKKLFEIDTKTNASKEVYSFPPLSFSNTEVFFKDGILLSQDETDSENKTYHQSLIWSSGSESKVIAQCSSNLHPIYFEVLDSKIIYTTDQNKGLSLNVYDFDTEEYTHIEPKHTMLENAFSLTKDKILTFEDCGNNAAFIIYDLSGNVLSEIPFDKNYCMFHYGLLENGIIASIEEITNEEFMSSKHKLLFIDFESSKIYEADTDSQFDFYFGNGKCVSFYKDRLYSVNADKNGIVLTDLLLDFNMYKKPKVMFDKGDVFLPGEWTYENYDTAKKFYKIDL